MGKKELVLIGAGKIGRGYMADIFNRAGYQLTFLEYSDALVKALNKQGYYTVFMNSSDDKDSKPTLTKFRIGGYKAYCTETQRQQCLDALAETNYATIHVYPGACESIGHMLGDAIKQRVARNNAEPLDIFMCVNFQGPAKIFKAYAKERLTTEEEKGYLEEKVGFVETMIFRSGENPAQEMLAEDPLCVSVSNTTNWPVDKDAFKGTPPEGVEMNLMGNFEARLVHKIWSGNMTHCSAAYYGKQRGYTYHYESELDPYIHKCSVLAKREADHGICAEYNVSVEEINTGYKKTPSRVDFSKVDTKNRDTLNRIGADPKRKLGRNGRFVGPALLAIKHGKVPFFLTRGAAMGFYFVNPEDAAAVEIQDFIRENGIEKAILKYCQLDPGDKNENFLYQMILGHYYEIGEFDPFDIK